ncbi:uncharacterized protein [Nicotiana tomentosiformis]|uniref:uncharacterized protein n=1 Tax=Nicotiana tomentosiformis TaxID=4098 RepID=UPI00388CAA1F
MVEELKKLTGRVQNIEVGKGVEGINYEDLCIHPDVELPEGYKPPKFEMFDGTGDPKVHLRTYCDKLIGVGKNEQIRMKLFMQSLTGDALSWYISQDPKKWVSWVSMASDFMDSFRFNTKNAPDIFYIQNFKKKPTETFREYATRWRSEAAKVRPALEEEQMNKFFIRVQDPQYYERLMVIENHKFFDIIKLGERIEEGIKSGMVTNFEALQAMKKALKSGDQLYERLKAVGYVTPILVVAMDNSSQLINPNKICAYHSGMKGHTIDECCTLKDKIQALIDTKVIQAKEVAPNVRNNPLLDHRGEGVNVIETDEKWDSEGSIVLIREGDAPKTSPVTLMPVVVQTQTPFEVELSTPFTMMVAPMPSYQSDIIPWDYVVEARRKGKGKIEEIGATQGITRTGRVYTPENLGGTSKEVASKPPIVETGNDDLCRKVQAREYSVVDHLNKTPAQISILSLLQNSDTHRNALMKVLSEAYVPTNISNGEMANMVGQVLESHRITFHEVELPPEGLSHNMALHITMRFEDKFIARVLDISATYNILLGRPWIYVADAVASTLHQAVKFERNHREVIIHGDGSNSIYTNLTVPVIENRKKLGGETYHRIERVNAIEKDRWWSNKIESILLWTSIIVTYPDEPTTVTYNETTRYKNSDSEDLKDDIIPEEIIREEKYIIFLKEYEDIFAWSDDDVTGLSTSIVAHRLPTNPMCPPVKQKLRKFKSDMSLKIKEEVTKQIKAKVLRVVEYPTWLANIVPVPKKDGKVRVCVDYRDLNRACLKDYFPLPNIDILIDNYAKHELQSFVDCFAGYHQIWMDEEDDEKTAFITPWGICCYKMITFGLKNA